MLALIFGIPAQVTPQSNLEATPQSEDIPQAGVQLHDWCGIRQFTPQSNLEAAPQSEDIPQAGVQLRDWWGIRQFLEKSVDLSLFLGCGNAILSHGFGWRVKNCSGERLEIGC